MHGCSSTPEAAPFPGTDKERDRVLKQKVEMSFAPTPENFTVRSGVLNQSEVLSQSGVAIAGVILEGQFQSPGWMLFLQEHPVRVEDNGSFKAFIPLRPPGNRFIYSASGPANKF